MLPVLSIWDNSFSVANVSLASMIADILTTTTGQLKMASHTIFMILRVGLGFEIQNLFLETVQHEM